MNSNGKIIMICGLTATGKDFILRYIVEAYNAHPVVSYTTRPKREGEVDGVEYHFTDIEYFMDLVNSGDIFEYRTYETLVNNVKDTWYYGCTESEVRDDVLNVVVLDDVGCREFIKEFGRDRCIGILVNAHRDVMEDLCKTRGDFDPTEFNRRLEADVPKFNAEFLNECIDYNIVNRGKGFGELLLEVDCLLEEIGIE